MKNEKLADGVFLHKIPRALTERVLDVYTSKERLSTWKLPEWPSNIMDLQLAYLSSDDKSLVGYNQVKNYGTNSPHVKFEFPPNSNYKIDVKCFASSVSTPG